MSKGIRAVLIVFMVGCISSLGAQVPNGGFEEWGDPNPDDWWTSNLAGLFTNVTETSDANSGSSALRGEVVEFGGTPLQPTIVAGSYLQGFAVSERHSAVEGYYKLDAIGNDQIEVFVSMSSGETFLGSGAGFMTEAGDDWMHFSVDIQYIQDGTPDLCFLSIGVVNPSGDFANVGTVMYLDDITLDGVVGIETGIGANIPVELALYQNYPNPFNPSTTINYQLPLASSVELAIYDLQGRKVRELVSAQRQTAGMQRVEWDGLNDFGVEVTSGIYFYKLVAGGEIHTRKLILTR